MLHLVFFASAILEVDIKPHIRYQTLKGMAYTRTQEWDQMAQKTWAWP